MADAIEVDQSSLGERMLNEDGGKGIKECLDWARRAYDTSVGADVWRYNTSSLKVVAQKAYGANASDMFFIAFRGTDNEENIISDLKFPLTSVHEALHFPETFSARIHSGFQDAYLTLRPKLWEWLEAQNKLDELTTCSTPEQSFVPEADETTCSTPEQSFVPEADEVTQVGSPASTGEKTSLLFCCHRRHSREAHELPTTKRLRPKVLELSTVGRPKTPELPTTMRLRPKILELSTVGRPKTPKIAKVIGHSLGGALATVAALDLSNADFEVELVTFGCPRVGDMGFKRLCQEKLTASHMARFVNTYDPVPRVPLELQGFEHICAPICLDSFITSACEVMGELLGVIDVPIKQQDIWSKAFIKLSAQHKLQVYGSNIQHYHDSVLGLMLKTGMRITPGANVLVARAALMSAAAANAPVAGALVATCKYLADMKQELVDGVNSISKQLDILHESVLSSIAKVTDRVIAHANESELLDIRALCTCVHDNTQMGIDNDKIMPQIMQLQEKLEKLRLRLERPEYCTEYPKVLVLELLLRAHALELFALSSVVAYNDTASDAANRMLTNRPKVLLQRLAPLLGEFIWSNAEHPGKAENILPARMALLNAIVALLGSRNAFAAEIRSMDGFGRLLDNPDSAEQRCEIALQRLPLAPGEPALAWFRQAARCTNLDADWAKFALGAQYWKLNDLQNALEQWHQIRDLSEKMHRLFPEAVISLCEGGVILFPHPRYGSLGEAIRVALEQVTGDNSAVVKVHQSVVNHCAISVSHGHLTIEGYKQKEWNKTSISCQCLEVQHGASVIVKDVRLCLKAGLAAKNCKELTLQGCEVASSGVGIVASENCRVHLVHGTRVSGTSYGLVARDHAKVTLGCCRISSQTNGIAAKATHYARFVLQKAAVKELLNQALVLEDHAAFRMNNEEWTPRSSCCRCSSGNCSEFDALSVH